MGSLIDGGVRRFGKKCQDLTAENDVRDNQGIGRQNQPESQEKYKALIRQLEQELRVSASQSQFLHNQAKFTCTSGVKTKSRTSFNWVNFSIDKEVTQSSCSAERKKGWRRRSLEKRILIHTISRAPTKSLDFYLFVDVCVTFISVVYVDAGLVLKWWGVFGAFLAIALRSGDCVLMRPSDSDKAPYVAKVENIEADHRNNVKVRVRWYYRPEESIGGRRQFHGAKELFLSDHFDVQSAHTIEGKCIVHTFKNYTKLENVGTEDYFCRFEYKAATGGFTPDRVAVYCKCEMPYNPDDLMVQCEGCKDWVPSRRARRFHPSCMGMAIEEAKKLDHFLCSDCSSDNDAKRSLNSSLVSSDDEGKVTDASLFKWSQSAGRGDTLVGMHHHEVVRFSCIAAHSSSSIIVVPWKCTVQRDAEP
ncbi:hypothetical protein SASPL_124431 [Salvia splendens]|uniref:BAH domain-containing protein n=1 Tax=Salvia splendens TaxID=180675 RepID=A0A8X8XRR3_SALSN|nr:hypothetical protein SASPL_124431 [Salvia splendens]